MSASLARRNSAHAPSSGFSANLHTVNGGAARTAGRGTHGDDPPAPGAGSTETHSTLWECGPQAGVIQETHRCVQALEGLLPLFHRLSEGYTVMRTRYGLLAERHALQLQRLDGLNKKAAHQADRIAKISAALDRQHGESAALKTQHGIFVLYKKEVSKYIEIFKSILQMKDREAGALCERNNDLERVNMEREHEIDALRGDVADKAARIERLVQEKSFVSARVRLREVENTVAARQSRLQSAVLSRYARECSAYESAVEMVGVRLRSIVASTHQMAWVHVALMSTLTLRASEASSLKSCLGESRGMVRRVLGSAHAAKEACLIMRSTCAGIFGVISAACQADDQRMAGLRTDVENVVLDRFKRIRRGVDRLDTGIRSCNSAGSSIAALKKRYAELMVRQRREFEAQKAQYERRIEKLGSRKAESSGDSNLWDIFQS